jgi:nucleotide-binding universal stress UspA family protein
VQAVADACAAVGVPCHGETTDGVQPWEAIVAHAEAKSCDLLVMGSQGRTGLSALLLGSETHDVLSHTRVPVLVVR